MLVDFDKAFKPSIEQEIRSIEKLIELHKKNIGKCYTCDHYVPMPEYWPGYAVSYGECKLMKRTFLDKIGKLDDVECSYYEEDKWHIQCWKNELEKLKNSRVEKSDKSK